MSPNRDEHIARRYYLILPHEALGPQNQFLNSGESVGTVIHSVFISFLVVHIYISQLITNAYFTVIIKCLFNTKYAK